LEPLQEYHSGYADDDDGSPLPSAHHRRQQSFPTLLPLSFRSRTPSPTRKTPRFSEQMPFTGDGRSGKADSPRGGGLAGWLSSASSPATAGAEDRTPSQNLPSKGGSRDATPDATPTRLRRSTTAAAGPASTEPTKKAIASTASRFMSAISRFAQASASPTLDDELCNLNVEAALISPTSPSGDTFSPAAYKNLQMNAIGLLTKMQNAYREKTIALKDLEAERGAQRDEIEEAETRAAHLKMQLEGMALKAAESEKSMQELVRELAAERRARAEEQRLIREKGIPLLTEGSTVSEDLGAEDDQLRRKWRKSASTVKSDETTFETDDESVEGESVFSRSRSPTIPPSAFEGSMVDGASGLSKSSGMLSPPKAKNGQQLTALQKIIKGISGDADAGTDGCRNCKGQDAGAAWDTVSLLRDENRHLKQRVGQLEDAVEGALDMVRGVGL
ncbi:hypothetical protein GQ53DRAFT_597572, partial [Thozetella sp. PMI_491]